MEEDRCALGLGLKLGSKVSQGRAAGVGEGEAVPHEGAGGDSILPAEGRKQSLLAHLNWPNPSSTDTCLLSLGAQSPCHMALTQKCWYPEDDTLKSHVEAHSACVKVELKVMGNT